MKISNPITFTELHMRPNVEFTENVMYIIGIFKSKIIIVIDLK